jgi:hypothetical protein
VDTLGKFNYLWFTNDQYELVLGKKTNLKFLLATEAKRKAGITLLKYQKPKTSKSFCGNHASNLSPP